MIVVGVLRSGAAAKDEVEEESVVEDAGNGLDDGASTPDLDGTQAPAPSVGKFSALSTDMSDVG